jgi:hypothetical protein
MSTETFEQTFSVTGTPTVKVGNIRGKIEVYPGDPGQVHVTAVKHTDSGIADRTEIRMFQNEEGHVIIETQYAHGMFGWLGFIQHPARVEYTVVVPPECQLYANSVSGEAHVRDLTGDLKINSVSGAVFAENLRGTLTLHTVSGKMEGKHLSGPLTLDSVSGKVILTESDLPTLKANTVSGNLTLETPLGEGPYRVDSVSGKLTLIVPDGSSCSATVSSVSGSVHTNLPNAEVWKNGSPGARHHRIRVGEGGPEIKLHSVSGSMHIVTSDAVVPDYLQSPSEPVVRTVAPAAPSKPSQMEILERIAHGELSVDEGLRALQAA